MCMIVSVCLTIYLFLCLSIHVFLRLSINRYSISCHDPSTHLRLPLSTFTSVYLPTHLSFLLFVNSSTIPPVYMSTHLPLSVNSSTFSSVYLLNYLSPCVRHASGSILLISETSRGLARECNITFLRIHLSFSLSFSLSCLLFCFFDIFSSFSLSLSSA